jgi:uncharacterized membrane protein YphA (DoxX/SURF4 family)
MDIGPLLLRLTVGFTLAAHGTQKLFGWFGGPGLDTIGQFFATLGSHSGRCLLSWLCIFRRFHITHPEKSDCPEALEHLCGNGFVLPVGQLGQLIQFRKTG